MNYPPVSRGDERSIPAPVDRGSADRGAIDRGSADRGAVDRGPVYGGPVDRSRPTSGRDATDRGDTGARRYEERAAPSGLRPDARSDRFDDSVRDRYVRVDGRTGGTANEANPPRGEGNVIDLRDAYPPRNTNAGLPSLSSSRRLRERLDTDTRFAPAKGDALRPELDSLRDSRLRSSGPSSRTRPVTRDSILERYSSPSVSDRDVARGRGSLESSERGDASAAARRLAATDSRRLAAESSRRGNPTGLDDRRARATDAERRRSAASDDARRAAAGDSARRSAESDAARRRLKSLDRLPREQSRTITDRSVFAARATDAALRTSVGVSLGFVGARGGFVGGSFGRGGGGYYGGYWHNDFANPYYGGWNNWYWNCYWPAWSSWYYGGGYWCPWGSGWGFGFSNRSFGFWYGSYWNRSRLCSPYYSYWCPQPIWYTTAFYSASPDVVVVQDDDDYEDGYGEGYDAGYSAGAANAPAAAPVPVGEGSFLKAQDQAKAEELSRAANHYLAVGDRAFREGRYGDAVHFYAKAVEFSPDDGVMYLILSDALFATGDYHYGAYALRRAFELDGSLAQAVVDKHEFYGDPVEFDRQLAVLEQYLEDHFLDDDARLLLAANYLFGGRPAAAVDLLNHSFSKAVRETPAGTAILKGAEAVQYGK